MSDQGAHTQPAHALVLSARNSEGIRPVCIPRAGPAGCPGATPGCSGPHEADPAVIPGAAPVPAPVCEAGSSGGARSRGVTRVSSFGARPPTQHDTLRVHPQCSCVRVSFLGRLDHGWTTFCLSVYPSGDVGIVSASFLGITLLRTWVLTDLQAPDFSSPG